MQFDVKIKSYFLFYVSTEQYDKDPQSEWGLFFSYNSGISYHMIATIQKNVGFARKIFRNEHSGKVRFEIRNLSDKKSSIAISDIVVETAQK